MQGELHGNVDYHDVELLLLFLLAIPKSLLNLKELYALVCTVFAYPGATLHYQLR